ncbi:hypothetical protein JCM19047_687 [Bacillus sp. JCM 19047]|nr:hypothetical protein JCM19047_687 [Bacillus sp. JCM 19047]
MYFGPENFCIFMKGEFGIDVREEEVGEETTYLLKEELSIEEAWTYDFPYEVRVDYCNVTVEGQEWIIGVVHEMVESIPLLLIATKNGNLSVVKKLSI